MLGAGIGHGEVVSESGRGSSEVAEWEKQGEWVATLRSIKAHYLLT